MSSVRRKGAVQAYKVDKNSWCSEEVFFMCIYIMKRMISKNQLIEEITFCNYMFF